MASSIGHTSEAGAPAQPASCACASETTGDAGALSYKAFAWDLNQTNCSGSVVKYDKPEVAGEAAAKAVLAKCPQLALTCANVTGEALALPPRSAWQLA